MKSLILNIMFLTLLFSACSEKYPIDLGESYKLDYDGNSYFYILDNNNTVIINSHITKFSFDSIFIIAEQKPVDLILNKKYDNKKMDFKKREEQFERSALRHYWVINKKEVRTYGPYKKEEYLEKRKELKVPKELLLKEE